MTTDTPRPALPRAVSRRALIFVVLTAAAWLVTALPLPWALASGVLGLAAVAMAIATMAAMGRDAGAGLWVFMTLGLMLAGGFALSAASAAVLYDAVDAYRECSIRAITITAEDECQAAFEEASAQRLSEVQDWVSRRLGSD